MRVPRPRTLLSLTLVGLGLVSLPLLLGVGNAVRKLSDLVEESGLAVRASEDATYENQRVARALTNMRRYGLQYFALDHDPSRLELYQASAENLATSLQSIALQRHPDSLDAELNRIRSTLLALNDTLIDPATTPTIVERDLDAMLAAASNIDVTMREAIADRISQLEDDVHATQRGLAWQTAALVPGTLLLVLFSFFISVVLSHGLCLHNYFESFKKNY